MSGKPGWMVDNQTRFFSNARPTNVRIGSGKAVMRARRPNFARIPAAFLNPQRARQKHKMWGFWRNEIQDNGVVLAMQGIPLVDNLCANC